MIPPNDLMRLAVEKCRAGIARGQSPFGCAIAIGDQLIACTHNTVLLSGDVTAHAEINALREASQRSDTLFLEGADVATTCEPCPMCMAALHWARVGTVYYGATIGDAGAAGFNELPLPAEEVVRRGKSRVKLVAGVLAEECRQLFEDWKQHPQARTY